MPTLLSPGVNVTEYDLTTIVPSVATSVGAIAGIFNWGPVGEPILVDTETTLVNTFGKPNSNNYQTFYGQVGATSQEGIQIPPLTNYGSLFKSQNASTWEAELNTFLFYRI